jgi:hypothetical protein
MDSQVWAPFKIFTAGQKLILDSWILHRASNCSNSLFVHVFLGLPIAFHLRLSGEFFPVPPPFIFAHIWKRLRPLVVAIFSCAVARSWEVFRRNVGITPGITPYGWRHTFVSINNMPEGLKRRRVGHAASMDTEGIYGQSVAGEDEQAAAYVEQRFERDFRRLAKTHFVTHLWLKGLNCEFAGKNRTSQKALNSALFFAFAHQKYVRANPQIWVQIPPAAPQKTYFPQWESGMSFLCGRAWYHHYKVSRFEQIGRNLFDFLKKHRLHIKHGKVHRRKGQTIEIFCVGRHLCKRIT